MIRFENVSVVFERNDRPFTAVKEVSLEIGKGQFFGIVGSSGAGKSTLVRTVNLLQRPTSGSVYIDGVDVTRLQGDGLSRLRQRIGMIFQHFNLIKNASVIDNIALALKASGTPKEKIRPRVLELLETVGLSDKAELYPNDLSGGQKQRVAIARALANNPEILLCDEATSALDPDNTREVVLTLKKIKESYPITILFITHQMDVAKSLFDEIAVMSDGQIVEKGSAYDLFARPKSEAAKHLISQSQNYELPQEVYDRTKNLYLITYREESAYESMIAAIAEKFKVELNIYAGKIEYVQGKPLGVLVISLDVEDEKLKTLVLSYIEERADLQKIKKPEDHHA